MFVFILQKMDKNKDGVVTLDEFIESCQEVRMKCQVQQKVQVMPPSLFSLPPNFICKEVPFHPGVPLLSKKTSSYKIGGALWCCWAIRAVGSGWSVLLILWQVHNYERAHNALYLPQYFIYLVVYLRGWRCVFGMRLEILVSASTVGFC